MNRRRFFAALAASPLAVPTAVKAAMKPAGDTTVSTLRVAIDTKSLQSTIDAGVTRLVAATAKIPSWLLRNAEREGEADVEQQMIEHDLFDAETFNAGRAN